MKAAKGKHRTQQKKTTERNVKAGLGVGLNYFAVAQISTYQEKDMHRLQFTQITVHHPREIIGELVNILERYPGAFITNIHIKYRPFHEWPKKWREV